MALIDSGHRPKIDMNSQNSSESDELAGEAVFRYHPTGAGRPMCTQLSSGFGIYTTKVRSPARRKEEFANADTQKWVAFRRLLEKREVILPVDGELLKQSQARRQQYDTKATI